MISLVVAGCFLKMSISTSRQLASFRRDRWSREVTNSESGTEWYTRGCEVSLYPSARFFLPEMSCDTLTTSGALSSRFDWLTSESYKYRNKPVAREQTQESTLNISLGSSSLGSILSGAK